MYEPVKRVLRGDAATETLAIKLGAAVLTSAAGISIAQPSDVVKVRFQAHSDLAARPYHGSLHAYRRILLDEGLLAGLYRGEPPASPFPPLFLLSFHPTSSEHQRRTAA